MQRPITFVLRILFLGFFAVSAYNMLQDATTFHSIFRRSYIKLERLVSTKARIRFPQFMANTFMDKNAELCLTILAYIQLGLCALAALLVPALTPIVAFVYLVLTALDFSVSDFTIPLKVNVEPLALAVALFIASLYFGCAKFAPRGTVADLKSVSSKTTRK